MSATKPVRLSRTALTLPVSTGALASTVRLDSKGALVLRKGRRRLRLAAPQVKLARKGVDHGDGGQAPGHDLHASAPAKGKAMRINAATGRATLQSARVTMPAAAGRRIRRALKLRRTPSGSFGTVTVIATFRPATPLGQAAAGARAARPGAARDRGRRERGRHRLGAQGVVRELHEHAGRPQRRHLHLRRRGPGGGPAREPGQGRGRLPVRLPAAARLVGCRVADRRARTTPAT